MAPESTTGVATIIGMVSTTLLALLGVDYYALLYATIASSTALLYTEKTTRARAAWITATSALLGAAIGTALAEKMGGQRSVLILCSIVCASGARPLIVALVNYLITQINKRAGDSPPSPPAT